MIINPLLLNIGKELGNNDLDSFFYNYSGKDDGIIEILKKYEIDRVYTHLKWFIFDFDKISESVFEKGYKDIDNLLSILKSDIDVDEKYMNTKAIINYITFENENYKVEDDQYYKLSSELQSEKLSNRINSMLLSYPIDIVSLPEKKIEYLMTMLSLINARVSESNLNDILFRNNFEIKQSFIDSLIYILMEIKKYLIYKDAIIKEMNIGDVLSVLKIYERLGYKP